MAHVQSSSKTGDSGSLSESWLERVKSKLHDALTRVKNTFGSK